MLNQSDWDERLRQRIATMRQALETGQDIDHKLLVLVLCNVEALLDTCAQQSAIIATTTGQTTMSVQLTLDDYYTKLLAMALREATSAPSIEYYRMWRRLKEVAEFVSKPRVDAALLAPYTKQLANDVDALMTKVTALETIVKAQAADNARLSAELDTAREQPTTTPQSSSTTAPSLKLQWQQIPSNNLVMCGAKLGEYIAEVWQLEDGTFRAWVRELSCVYRSDSGLASLGLAQTIAEQWLDDLLAKQIEKLRDLQSVFDDSGSFTVGDVVKARGGSLGVVVAERGDLIRVVFDDGVRLGIIPNLSPNNTEEPIIQHVTPRRRVVVAPELDSHDVELRRMLVRHLLADNEGKTT